MKTTIADMIINWAHAGYTIDEIAPLIPQIPRDEIAAIIRQHDERSRN